MSEEVSFIADALVWYTLSLLIFFGLFYWKGRRPVLAWIDGEIAKVRVEFEQAKKLRGEADAALVSVRARQQAVTKEAEAIIAHAQEQAAQMQGAAMETLRHVLRRREQLAMDRIALAETEAVNAVRRAVIDKAVAAAKATLATQLDAALIERLANQAIAEVPQLAAVKAKAA